MSVYVKDRKCSYLFLNTKTEVFYVRKKKRGKRPLFKSTGEKQRGRAQTKADLMIAEWLGKSSAAYQSPLFRDFATQYLEYLEESEGLRPRTIVNAKLYIGQLIDELGYIPIDQINEGFVDEWLASFRKKNTRTTFEDYTKYLSKVMRHAYRKELIARMPEFKNPDPKRETGRVYTREEVQAMLDVSAEMPRGRAIHLQLRLALNCFMRLREALLLSWDRVDLDTGIITLRPEDVKTGSRTGKGRSFYVRPEVLGLLRAHKAKEKDRSPWVFPSRGDKTRPAWSNKKAWQSVKRLAGVRGKARWHDLRHTALTWALVEQKANPLMVSAYAGVDLRTITCVYLKVRPEHTKDVALAIEI